ncbi:MAG: hypothetical protein ACK5IJ_08580 [Mangrovibacterium sp.]
MKPKTPLYILSGEMYKNTKDSNSEKIEIYHEYDTKEKALSMYQSYIEVFMESIGEEFTCVEAAEIALHRYLRKHENDIVNILGDEVSDDVFNGLWVWYVPDANKFYVLKEGGRYYRYREVVASFGDDLLL